ncbi:class I adenylate-forming enzyme family protein [Actinokineospora terrae]|uniref:Long-chain acyl-CoA synthetase n=1 Tax=Actinokineospora terrae TaxID=155974 RepID=A0A1H9WII0_9PSEU|nr:class I adenylate-forming enzyme family protein [Actinokineospora terrae]SES33726.1 long-chain acyl-CoA synthetase [Actinokineospora terrae]
MHTLVRRLLRGNGFYLGLIFETAARRRPDLEITLDRPLAWAPDTGTRFTAAGLADMVDDIAARLWAAGVRPTERVAIYKTNNFDIALFACAAARIGAVPALLSPALDGETAFVLLHRLDQPWLITDGDTLDGALDDVPVAGATRGVLLTAGESRIGTGHLADLAGAPRRPAVVLHPGEPSLISHSSGTTGIPKLAVHCPEAGYHRLIPQQLAAWPIRGREKAALCMTFVHSRFYQGLAMWLSLGNPLVIAVDPDPRSVGPLLIQTRPGYVETHPNNYVDWEVLADAEGAPLSSVRYFGATFDAMHPRTIERMLGASRRPRPLFLQAYGQSEIGPVAGRWYTRRTAGDADGRCVGMPLPGFISLRVVDDQGRRVRRGTVGHLQVRSRTRILTYLGEHERYTSQLDDGWWRLGDMGYLDRKGLLHLLDREADRIATMESNLEVEDVLMSRLEELREIVIVAGPTGEPVPIVSTRDDAPLDLERWARAVRDLPEMAQPRQIDFEELPRTSTWKIQRHQLAKRLRAERSAPPQRVTREEGAGA